MPQHHYFSVLLSLACALLPSAAPAAARQDSPATLSDTAFVLARAGVVPENIVYDALRDRFLGGDLERMA